MISCELFSSLFPFRGLSSEVVGEIFSEKKFTERAFRRGECVFSKSSGDAVGFVTDGECEVVRYKHDGSAVALNRLAVGDSFGILSVFGAEDFPTEVVALRSSTVLFIERDDFLSLLAEHSEISLNIITFLAERISFLNSKIKTFSGTRVEDRLASFLSAEVDKKGLSFPFNCKKTAEAINSGRASVYRAISSLEEAGLIKFDTKSISVLDYEGLKSF